MATTLAAPTTLELTCGRSPLLEVLLLAKSAVSTKKTLPILRGVLITVTDGGARLQATDLDQWVSLPLPGETAGEGAVVLSADRLTSIIGALPADASPVRIRVRGTTATLTAGGARFELVTMIPEEFPDAPTRATRALGEVPGTALATALRAASPFTSEAESRPIINGVCLHAEQGPLLAVATDGGALALVPIAEAADFAEHFIVPRTGAATFAKLADGCERVRLSADGQSLRLDANDRMAITRLIEGPYVPGWRGILNAPRPLVATLDRKQFLKAVERVALVCGDSEFERVRLTWSPTAVTIAAENDDVGRARESIPCDAPGVELELAHNQAQLVRCLKLVTTEQVIVRLQSATTPVLFEGTTTGGPQAVCVNMAPRR